MLKAVGALRAVSAATMFKGRRSSADCVLSFTSPAYYYNEDEGYAELDIVRLGCLTGNVAVKWKTKKESAIPGKDYIEAQGELIFSKEERRAKICIAILPNVGWNQDINFHVQLYDCRCDAFGKNAYIITGDSTVWIVNDTQYPQGCPRKPKPEVLLHKFFLERCMARGRKVKITAYCYVYKAFYDCVIENICLAIIFDAAVRLELAGEQREKRNDDESHSSDSGGGGNDDEKERLRMKQMTLVVSAVAVLILATKLAERCDFTQLDLRGRSGTRKDLRNWMIGRYTRLGVNAFSQHNVDSGHMINCLNNHVEEAVVKGWYQLFKIVEAVFGLFFSVLVVIYLTYDSSTNTVEYRAALPILPSIAMALYVNTHFIFFSHEPISKAAQSREAENVRLVKDRMRKEDEWISLANEILSQSSVVRTFKKQDAVAKEFKTNYEIFYKVHRKHRKFELGTVWKCHWYNGVIYYGLLVAGPLFIVSSGLMSAAKLIIIVKLYSSVDKYTVQLLMSISDIQRASIALCAIRKVLNLPTQGHEVGAPGTQPQFDETENDFEISEVFSLLVFLFCNGRDPGAVHATEFMQKVGQIAAERSVVLTSALQRRSSEAKTAAHTIVHSGEEKLLSRFRKRASIRSVGLMAATGVHHHNKRISSAVHPLHSEEKSIGTAGCVVDDEAEAAEEAEEDIECLVLPGEPKKTAVAHLVPEEEPSPPESASPGGATSRSPPSYAMAKGTGALYTWMFNETSIDAFDHIQLVDVTLKVDRGRGDGSDGLCLLKNVTTRVPLGKLYCIAGGVPQVGKGIGRGTVLEMLCGLRLVSGGFLGLPPHLRCVMLTENTTCFFDMTVEESILWGHPDPGSVKMETIHSAMKLAGLHDDYFHELKEARKHRAMREGECPCFQGRPRTDSDSEQRKSEAASVEVRGLEKHRKGVRCRFKVGKNAQHVRVVDRTSMMIARAFLADVDVIVLNRTELLFSDDQRLRLYGSLRRWVDHGLTGAENLCAGVPRLRTVFITQHEKQHPPQVNAELLLGQGEGGTGVQVRLL